MALLHFLAQKKTALLWLLFGVAFILFVLFFNQSLDYEKPGDTESGNQYETAKVIKINADTIAPDPQFPDITIGRQELILEILTGEHKGKVVTAINFVERMKNAPAAVGTQMVVSSYDGFTSTVVVDYNRENTTYILVLVFLVAVVAFGGIKGLKSIVSLVFTLISIIFLFLPMIIRGYDPIISAVFIVMLSTAVTHLMLNGNSRKTMISILSCVVCTFMAGLLAYWAGNAASISTLNTPEAEDLLYISQNTALNVRNLFFAGILFSSLGAIMDTTMSITSAIFELKTVNAALTEAELFKSGMNIGRDIMGTMTNTLILAFTGSSINIFLMYYMYQYPYTRLMSLQSMVIEIIQGISGSTAVVLSIPVTAFLAAAAAGSKHRIPLRPTFHSLRRRPENSSI